MEAACPVPRRTASHGTDRFGAQGGHLRRAVGEGWILAARGPVTGTEPHTPSPGSPHPAAVSPAIPSTRPSASRASPHGASCPLAGVIVAALLAVASGRREARVLIGVPGAHGASPHPFRRHAWLTLAASLLTILVAAPGAAATGTTTASTTTTLTTTVVDRPWFTTEQFYIGLANCTRTGGWVLSDGTCRGYGTGHYSAYVPPLKVSSYIADRVSRPYSSLLATKALCTHYANGDPGYRLRRVGLTNPTWGENIGCRDGYSTAKAAVLASHLVFQSEKSTNGGHWRNLKNRSYYYIGVGIWRYGSRTRLVVDFYL